MDKTRVLSIADINTGPFYLYDLQVIQEKVSQLKCALPEFSLLYSIKANPHPSIIKCFATLGVGFDAASINEVQLALTQGSKSTSVFYSAPGKTICDLNDALDCCQIIVDSINEIVQLNSLAASIDRKIQVGVRLNIENTKITKSTHEIMSGCASKFGITLKDYIGLNKTAFPNIDFVGIHVYFGSQLLDIELISHNFHIISEVALLLNRANNIQYVNFGGGFGIPYEKSESCIDIRQLSELIHNDLAFQKLSQTSVNLNLELGRFLVAECGCFVAKVLDIKNSYGKKYVIIDGGMNAFYRPIMTGDFHDIIQFNASGKLETVTLVGKLCTPIDQYYKDIVLPSFSIGDVVAFINAGAYGYSMSLLEFISYDKPQEILVGGEQE